MNNSREYSFEEMLEKKGFLIYTNVGNSMLPLLRQRKDIIEIRSKGSKRCNKYDVVLYKRGNKYILHRILKVLPDRYIIAGDHNAFLDPDVKDYQIIGIMTRIFRDGKSIDTGNVLYRLYVHLWCDIYPIRMMILQCMINIRRIYSFLKRVIRHDYRSIH